MQLLPTAAWSPLFMRVPEGYSLKSIPLAREMTIFDCLLLGSAMEMQAFPLLSPYVAVLAYGTASVRLSHARASTVAAFALNTCKTLLKKRLRLQQIRS